MNRNKIILYSVVLVIILGGSVAFISTRTQTSKNTIDSAGNLPDQTLPINTDTSTVVDYNNSGGFVNGVFIPTSTLLAGEDISIEAIKYTNLPSDLFLENFSWQKPEKINGLGIVVNQYSDCDGPGCNYYSEKGTQYFRVAKFTYKQKIGEIILASLNLSDVYVVKFSDNLTVLEKDSLLLSNTDGLNKLKFLVDKTLSLPKNDDTPKEINIPGKQKLFLTGRQSASSFLGDYGSYNLGGIKREKIAYFENKDIWNCGDFFVTFTNNIEGIQPSTYNIKLPTVFNFDNGKKEITSYYDSQRDSGCGQHDGVKVLTDIKESDLEKIGKADDGNMIFKFKDIGEESDSSQMWKNYNGYMEVATAPTTTYEKFLSENPIIIMKDGFGRYIQFLKKELVRTTAECGKPVIYLYPKTETKVNVQVKPNGGLTKVDPFYPVNGWLVNAKPNGELTNISNRQNYPYLFWEGKAYDLKVPSEGFVLRRENVQRDMTKLLSKLGLNEKEITDFLEFWQAKLEEKPYVFVTFVSQTDFDKVAPLTISPRPDKVIRVFMDYQPLDLPMKVRPLKIETPVRPGFTAVEWGGQLHQ